MEREVPASQAYTAQQNSPSWPFGVDQQAGGDAHGVHPEVACIADDVDLGGGEGEVFGELGRPG